MPVSESSRNKKAGGKNAGSGKHRHRQQKKNTVALARRQALQVLMQVADGMSLSALPAKLASELDDARDRALTQELVYGVLRWQVKLDCLIQALLAKALKPKDQDVQWLLRLALYELLECRAPDYAVINDAVALVRQRRKNWASGLVNAVLRTFLREKESLLQTLSQSPQLSQQFLYSHPLWLQQKIQQDWPDDWQQILQANNQRPPLWLRVNARQNTAEAYAEKLLQVDIASQPYAYAREALKLDKAVEVTTLPGFTEGAVSVQDAGAQLAAALLAPEPGDAVLDLCAAPGGKTCHLLETYPQIKQMLAVEIDSTRMQRVRENLERLKLDAECIVADAATAIPGLHADESGCGGRLFERILLDVPCSASGVIRRHPDIKSLRRETDIDELSGLQASILCHAWSLLAPGGRLLYVTCSLLRQENQQQVAAFLQANPDAQEVVFTADWGVACSPGRQLLPGIDDTDGFYFCLLEKQKAG